MSKNKFKKFLDKKKQKFDESKIILKAQVHGIKERDKLKVNDVWNAIKYIGAENKANQSIIFSVITWLIMSNNAGWLWKTMFVFSLVGVFQQMRNVWKVQKLIKGGE